jgi:hypothetical protein
MQHYRVTRRYNGQADKNTVVQADSADQAEFTAAHELLPAVIEYTAVEMNDSDMAGYYRQLSKKQSQTNED